MGQVVTSEANWDEIEKGELQLERRHMPAPHLFTSQRASCILRDKLKPSHAHAHLNI